MAKLHLHLLGSPIVEIDGQTADIQRRKALALFVYLAVTRQVQQRDSLAAMFWPDDSQSKARAALSRHLTELRNVIGEAYLVADRETISLTGDIWLDANEFRQLATDDSSSVERLQTAVSLYHADFLSGFNSI